MSRGRRRHVNQFLKTSVGHSSQTTIPTQVMEGLRTSSIRRPLKVVAALCLVSAPVIVLLMPPESPNPNPPAITYPLPVPSLTFEQPHSDDGPSALNAQLQAEYPATTSTTANAANAP